MTFLALAFGLFTSFASASSTIPGESAPAKLTLDRSVYFHSPAQDVVQLAPGEYQVDFAGENLKLTSADGKQFALQATWNSHRASLESPFAVTFPGEDELKSVRFVALLFPGGSSLEAAGSDTGVFERGVKDSLNKLKQKVGNAATNAAQTAGKAIQAVTSGGVAALTGFLQNISEFVACLTAPEDKGPGTLGDYLQRFQEHGPAGFVQYIVDDQNKRMQDKIQLLVGPDLKRLRNGEGPPSLEQIIDESMVKLEALSQDRKITRCSFDFLKPSLPKMKKVVLDAQKAGEDAVMGVMEKTIVDPLAEGISKLMAEAFDETADSEVGTRGLLDNNPELKAAWEWEKRIVNSGLYLESLTVQLASATEQLNTARTAGDKAAMQLAIETTAQFADDAYLRFALGVVRYRGHKIISTKGDKLILSAVGTVEASFATGDEVVDGAAGVVPEAGAAAKSVADTPRHWIRNMIVRPLIVALIGKGIHLGWELACNHWEKQIVVKGRPTVTPPPSVFPLTIAVSLAVQGLMLKAFDVKEAKLRKIAANNRPQGSMDALKAYNDQLKLVVDHWAK